jgi:hypothetical protein
LAFFGRFNWSWFFALAGSLAFVAGAQGLASFIDSGSAGVFQSAGGLIDTARNNSKNFFYGLSGMGAVALAALAMFGRFSWGWFFGIVGGLALVALLGPLGSGGGGTIGDFIGINSDLGSANETAFTQAESLADNTARRIKSAVYGLAGIGAVALAILAFTGKFNWRWMFALIGGLMLIGGATVGIQYITSESVY